MMRRIATSHVFVLNQILNQIKTIRHSLADELKVARTELKSSFRPPLWNFAGYLRWRQKEQRVRKLDQRETDLDLQAQCYIEAIAQAEDGNIQPAIVLINDLLQMPDTLQILCPSVTSYAVTRSNLELPQMQLARMETPQF